MYFNRCNDGGRRIATALLTVAIASAGLGLSALPAMADEGEAPAPQQQAAAGFRVLFADASSPAAGAAQTVTASHGVAAKPVEASALFDAINAQRNAIGLDALPYDAALTSAAYQRANEAAVLEASTRPDGSSFVGADPTGRATDEALVAGSYGEMSSYADVAGAVSELVNRGDLGSLGLAAVADGDRFIYVLLATTAPFDEGQASSGFSVEQDAPVSNGLPLDASLVTLDASGEAGALAVGEPYTVSVAGTYSSGAGVSLWRSAFDWASSDPAVASVDGDGVVTAAANGDVTIEASGPAGLQATYAFTASGAPEPVDLADTTVAGIIDQNVVSDFETPREPSFTIIGPDNTTIDPSQYAYEFTNNVQPGEATLTITAVEGSPYVVGELVKTFEIQAPASTEATVPDVTGFDQGDATSALAAEGIANPQFVIGDPAPTAEQAGTVQSTDPAAGEVVDTAVQTVQVALYAEAAPADEEGAPAEEGSGEAQDSDQVVPEDADGQEAPADEAGGQESPADGTDGQEAPADEQAAPDDGQEAPAEETQEQDAPAEEQGAPADEAEGQPAEEGQEQAAGEGEAAEDVDTSVADEGEDEAVQMTVDAIPDQIYTGEAIVPSFSVKVNGEAVSSDAFTVQSIENNVEVGTATMVVAGKAGQAYEGLVSDPVTFNIVEAPASLVDISSFSAHIIAEGVPVKVIGPGQTATVTVDEVAVEDGNGKRLATEDYVVDRIENASQPGTATVYLKGVEANGYTGSVSTTFAVKGAIGQAVASLPSSQTQNLFYTGSPITPTPSVVFGSTTLRQNDDYALSYTNNVNAGTASITVTGTGNYTGEQVINFTIQPKSIRSAQVSPLPAVDYMGVPIEPAVNVVDGTVPLAAGVDYDVAYSANVNAGTAHVTVAGKGNYRDSIDATFVINKVDLRKATVTMPNMVYTGSAITPKPVSVKIGEFSLVEGVDYDIVNYGNNVQVGEAKVTLQGKGNFSGTKVAGFKIVPSGTNSPGQTQTLPATGDDTNIPLIVGGAVAGVALVGAGTGLVLYNRKKNRK